MIKENVRKLGFWSGILSSLFSVVWFITFMSRDVIAPMPVWQNLEAYAHAFSPLRLLYVYPSLLLPLSYLLLVACIHHITSEDKKIWSLIAFSIGIIYATMAGVNYNIQAVAVRASLAVGEIAGIEMFLPDNPNSIFGALANSYVYLSLSMVSAGFVFQGGRLEKWIRAILLLQLITAVGQIGSTMFDLSDTLFIATSMVWVVGAPIVFVLLGILFRRGLPDK